MHTAAWQEGQAATCDGAGFVGYWYCKECLNDTTATHYGKCYSDEAMTTEIADINLPALGHEWRAATAADGKDAYTAPTCTGTGLYYDICTRCGTQGELHEIPALGHSDYKYTDNGNGTHKVTCGVCSAVIEAAEAHVYVEGTCPCGAKETTEPTYLPELKFLTTSVSLGSSLNRLYVIQKTTVSAYTSFYVEIEKDVWNSDPVVYRFDNLDDYITSTKAYTLQFTNIAAKEMGDEFRATIHAFDADGKEYYGPTTTSSMEDYLKNVLRNGTTAAQVKMKPLCVDMLRYGAAAQKYFEYNTENLVDSDLTEEELALGTQIVPEYTSKYAVTDTDKEIKVQAKAAAFGSKVTMNIIFNVTNYTGNTDELVYKVIDENGDTVASGPVTVTGTTRKTCTVKFDDVAAKKMRATYKTGLYNGDTLVSEVQVWSIESYVATIMEGTNYKQTMKDLAVAMLIYGDAAANYLAS